MTQEPLQGQDAFVDAARAQATRVSVFLVNGIRLVVASNRSTGIWCRCARRQGCSSCTNMQYRRSSRTRKELDPSRMQIFRLKLHMTKTSSNRLLSLANDAFRRPSTVGRRTTLHEGRYLRALAGHIGESDDRLVRDLFTWQRWES
jgi:hypothetical protein